MPKETFLRLRDEKQEIIIHAAINEFVKYGFNQAKIEDIARNAGVAKGSIYQYFENKKELYVYCAEWGLNKFMKKLNERINIDDIDIFEYFQDNVAKTEIIKEERTLTVFLQTMAKEPELITQPLKAMYKVGETYGRKLIQNSKKKGLIRTDIEDDLLLDYFFAVTEKFKMRWMNNKNIDFAAELTEEQSQIINSELEIMIKLLKEGMGCYPA